jgi:histidine triad (HIT) family protein
MSDCIFCKIANGEMPSYKIYEDEHALAILDIHPSKKGQTLVIPKIHTTSNFTKADTTLLHQAMDTALGAAKLLEQKLGYARSFIVIQGLGIDHLHIKIYPMYQGNDESIDTRGPEEMEKVETLEELQKRITH